MSSKATKLDNRETLRREFVIERDAFNEEKRTVDLCFATEAPVERYFGSEVLDMEVKSVRMNRLSNRAPLLLNHDPEKQIGVVESARVDSGDKKARATVRFGKSALAQEIFQDVKDGIRSLVSVGYQIHKMQTEKQSGGAELQRAVDWEPLEISIVAIPADVSAGVGRALTDESNQTAETNNSVTQIKSMSAENIAAPAAPVITVNESSVRAEERKRSADIRNIAKRHKCDDLAEAAINEGISAESFGSRVLGELAKRDGSGVREVSASAGDLGMSKREVGEFSIKKAIADIAFGRGLQGIEREASEAFAKKFGRELVPNQFIIPNDVSRRDMSAGTADAGGYTVQTTVGPLIELLRNRMVTTQAGVQMLAGLTGNVSLPKQTAAATAYWTTETGAATESQQTLGQVALSPKRCAAFTDVSKQLLAQSTIDAEAFVRNDLATILALALDKAVLEGSGSSNQPTGILNTSGVGSVTFGAAATWAKLVSFETTVKTANADIATINFVSTPASVGKWKTNVKVSSYPVFIMENGEVNGYPVLSTNQVSSNKVIFGAYSAAALGVWSGVSVLVDPYTQATSGLVRLVADVYADVAVRQAAAFCVSSDSGAQ